MIVRNSDHDVGSDSRAKQAGMLYSAERKTEQLSIVPNPLTKIHVTDSRWSDGTAEHRVRRVVYKVQLKHIRNNIIHIMKTETHYLTLLTLADRMLLLEFL